MFLRVYVKNLFGSVKCKQTLGHFAWHLHKVECRSYSFPSHLLPLVIEICTNKQYNCYFHHYLITSSLSYVVALYSTHTVLIAFTGKTSKPRWMTLTCGIYILTSTGKRYGWSMNHKSCQTSLAMSSNILTLAYALETLT